MIQVRRNVFETNSSSTHSLVMAVESEFEKWRKGETYYCDSFYDSIMPHKFESGKFYPVDEVDKYYESKGYDRDSYYFKTYEEFTDSDYLECSTYSYTTPGGEAIKAIAKYGYEG